MMKSTSASLIWAWAAEGLNRPQPGCRANLRVSVWSIAGLIAERPGGGGEVEEEEERISQPRGGEALEGGGYDGADRLGKAEGI